ncbi:MAG: acyloxyacyl hydrolase [Terriglobales bacterium]
MSGCFGDGFKIVIVFRSYGAVHVVSNRKKSEIEGTWESIFAFQTFRVPLGLGSRFSWIAASTLGIAMLAVLAIAVPLQAQSDQGLILVYQECDVVNLQNNYTPDATFSFGGRGTSAVEARDGAGAETEVAPQTSLSYPFATFRESWEARDSCSGLFSALKPSARSGAPHPEPGAEGNTPGKDSKESSNPILRDYSPTDRNRSIYYKNKLEFSLEGGWLPINIPFPFDFLLGSGYNFPGLYYTLVPIIASVRWQVDDVGGPWVLRGNWDVTFSGSVTAIPRGAETRYFSYMMGIRRNFVPRRWRVAPYLDGRAGLGNIDAKGPLGVEYSQGQNFTFTLSLGSGVRYNFNPRYAIQAGMNYMHISNLYLSEPKYLNYGINVYGPWVGIDITFGKHRPAVQ